MPKLHRQVGWLRVRLRLQLGLHWRATRSCDLELRSAGHARFPLRSLDDGSLCRLGGRLGRRQWCAWINGDHCTQPTMGVQWHRLPSQRDGQCRLRRRPRQGDGQRGSREPRWPLFQAV